MTMAEMGAQYARDADVLTEMIARTNVRLREALAAGDADGVYRQRRLLRFHREQLGQMRMIAEHLLHYYDKDRRDAYADAFRYTAGK